MLLRKILGLSLAAAIAVAAACLYLDFNTQVRMFRGTVIDDLIGIGVLRDLQYILWAVIVFIALWAVEKIWDTAANRFWPEADH